MKRFAILIMLAWATTAWGTSVRFQHDGGGPSDGDSTADNFIEGGASTDTISNAGGVLTTMAVGMWTGQTIKDHIILSWPRFDDSLATLGLVAANIDSAVCSLYVYFETDDMSAGTYYYTEHQITSDWEEGTGTSLTSDTTNSSNWVFSDKAGAGASTVKWTTPGGDYSATKLDSFSYVTDGASSGINTWKMLRIPKAVCSTWVAGTNYGILIRHSTENISDTYIGIRPRDYAADATKRPILRVYYTQTQSALVIGGNTVIGGGVILGGK